MEQTIIKELKILPDGTMSVTTGVDTSEVWDATLILDVSQISALLQLLAK